MASHQQGAQTSAQTYLGRSLNGPQGGLLPNSEPHLSQLNQAHQRACPCKRCWRFQQASNSPPPSEVTRKYTRLQHEGVQACAGAGAGADFNEECRYGIHPSHGPAHASLHVPAPRAPCHCFDSPHVPRSPLGASSAHGFSPVPSRFSPSSQNQERDWKQNDPRVEPNSKKSGSYGRSPNQVVLYRWFLIRCGGSSQGVEISVGGFLTPRTAGTEKFKTAAIVQRIEKCRLLAYDGLEVLLAGLIDDCTTISNGFSLDIVHGFLSGFPYTWNLLLNNELCSPNPRCTDHQVSGNCGLAGGVETSQLSFEGSDQEKRTSSPGFCDHPEKATNLEPNIKQTMNAEVRSEKEEATLKNNDSNTGPLMEGAEKLDTISSKDGQVSNSNSTGLVEQEMIDVRTKEGRQEYAHGDQSRCKIKKGLGKASKTQPCVGSEENGTAHTEIGAGNALLKKSNGSTGSVEKKDECDQKSQLTPRITRSMQKINRHVASSHNISIGVNLGAHCDSLNNCEEVHTPLEQCGPHVKPISSTTPSTIYQKRVDNKRSRRTLPKDNDRENTNGGKPSNMSPCYYTGVKSPLEMRVQRPENPMNAEASPSSKEEAHSNLQKEVFTVETVQACDHGNTDEEDNLFASVQKSKEHAPSKSDEKLTKASQKKLNRGKSGSLSKSPGKGSKCPKIPPPLPCPRAPVSKRLISAAFGFKTSRSGRLLVPPLAHWCSQALLRNKDGGIIGVSEGSKNMSKDGYFKFTPPAEAGLRKLQKRLCDVATDCTPRKKRLGTKKGW